MNLNEKIELLGKETNIKDSGERRKFETGAVRDMAEGKGRFDFKISIKTFCGVNVVS